MIMIFTIIMFENVDVDQTYVVFLIVKYVCLILTPHKFI